MAYICSNCEEPTEVLCGPLKVCLGCACEWKRIEVQCKIAHRAGLPADLTLAEWTRAVRFFNGKCAYCKAQDFLLIEHFIPVSCGGGTTAKNIIPACVTCNTRKRNLLPEQVKRIPKEAIERVREYLTNL